MEDVKLYLVNQFSHFTYYNFVLLPFLLLLLLTVIALGFKEKEVVQRSSVKKVFLEISQNLQENACVRVSFLIKMLVINLLNRSVRSTRFQMFFKKGVLKNFAILTGKHLCWSLF